MPRRFKSKGKDNNIVGCNGQFKFNFNFE